MNYPTNKNHLKDVRAMLETDIDLPVLRIAVAVARKEIKNN